MSKLANLDRELLAAAAIGFDHQIRVLGSKRDAIVQQLATEDAARTTRPAETRRRDLSAAARKSIALAQKKRWKKFHAAKAAVAAKQAKAKPKTMAARA